MQSVWVALIPAYQPTDILLQVLRETRDQGFTPVIVNDGSSKNKEPLFRKAAVYGTVLHHTMNLGKGQALKTGLSYIQTHFPPDSIVVTIDSDGQHRIADAVKICRVAQEHPEALVLGSRALKKNVPIRSLVGNSITKAVYRISTGQKIQDTQTGLRAFGAGLIPLMLEIPGSRYEYEMNVLLNFSSKGLPIREVEIDTVYIDGNMASHFDTVRDSFHIYKEILKFSAASLISFGVDYGLYNLITLLTAGLGSVESTVISNVGARLVSATVNYSLNRKLVFGSKKSIAVSAAQYAVLAGIILAGNTVTLSLLTKILGMNPYVAKLVTESIFFLGSWWIQRQIVFHQKEKTK